MSQHVIPLRLNALIFLLLLGLLGLTVSAAYMDLGRYNLAVAMTIAIVKAALILLYFMHIRYSPRLTWVFASAAFFWLAILLSLSLSDFLSRGWLAIPGK